MIQKRIVASDPWLKHYFRFLRKIGHAFQFNSSTEGSLIKHLFDTAHNEFNFKYVDILKFRLIHYDTFYNGSKIVMRVSWC